MAYHHDTLFNALCDEIQELDPEANLKTERALWRFSAPTEETRRRDCLRDLVNILRAGRRGSEAQVAAALAFPRRLFSYLPVYRKAFTRCSPDDAAATVAMLLASTKSDIEVVAKLQKMRKGAPPIGATFVHRGWYRVEMHLARRAGELSADLMAYTWCAGEMPWSEFLEVMRAMRTDILEKFVAARGEPMVDEVLNLVELADLEDSGDDDGDSR